MRGKKCKQLRNLLKERDLHLLVFINKVYGERTHNMSDRGVYQATKRLYKEGYIALNNDGTWEELKRV